MGGVSVTTSHDSNVNAMHVTLPHRITKYDDTTIADEFIVGEAQPGTATSDAHWLIYKYNADGERTFRYGSIKFDQVWDNIADDANWS